MKVLVFALLLASAVPVYATTAPTNTTVERKQTTTVERDDDDDSGKWGWLGLLGLGGLAGLMRKPDNTYRERNPDGTFTTRKNP